MYQQNSFANNNMFCQTIEASNNFGPTQSSHQDLKTVSTNDDIMVPRRCNGNIMPQRIPCRARGIPGKHDASNAYIEIPPNAKHGTLLTCSAPNCVLTGRLFQFCAVCQLPVSKVRSCFARDTKKYIVHLSDNLTLFFSSPGKLRQTTRAWDERIFAEISLL